MTSLAGRIVVVTGGSRGIGEAVAGGVREAGGHAVRLARGLVARSDHRATDLPCDVTDEAAVARVADRVVADVGRPDAVVNNAGGFLLKPFGETTTEEFAAQVAVNLTGSFLVVRAFLDALVAQRGHLVTIGSIVDHRTFPGNAAYGASKRGLRGLHEVVAEEYRGTLRTTLVSPGPTDTVLWDPLEPDGRDDLPSRRAMLRPHDVADAVLFALTRPRPINIDVIRLSSGS